MKCEIDVTSIIFDELITNEALSLIKPGFHLAYVLSHDISFVIKRNLQYHNLKVAGCDPQSREASVAKHEEKISGSSIIESCIFKCCDWKLLAE